jgi:hypothetical protein
MLADQGEFHSYLPEDNLILVQIPQTDNFNELISAVKS